MYTEYFYLHSNRKLNAIENNSNENPKWEYFVVFVLH